MLTFKFNDKKWWKSRKKIILVLKKNIKSFSFPEIYKLIWLAKIKSNNWIVVDRMRTSSLLSSENQNQTFSEAASILRD